MAARRWMSIAGWAICAASLGSVVGQEFCVAMPQGAAASSGKILFERSWNVGDSGAGADGLGPLFNADSCASCHHLGGVGGAGANDENVDLLAVHWDKLSSEGDRERARQVAREIHPELERLSALPLHRFAIDPDYERWRFQALGLKPGSRALTWEDKGKLYGTLAARLTASQGPLYFKHRRVPFVLTQRNPPALFGAGWIDQISEDALRELADEQRGQSLGISGRLAVSNDVAGDPFTDRKTREADNPGGVPPVGKFGWKGHTASLAEFVLAACANELGLQTIHHAQPLSPDSGGRPVEKDDLTPQQCRSLLMFVAKLPPPVPPTHTRLDASATARMGETLFSNLGCVHCHVPMVDGVAGIYSDLLLHDMGGELADPVLANPPRGREFPDARQIGGWGVAALPPSSILSTGEIRELSRDWRTPPLWGVADSAPYLHDGRAATLHQAIRLHGGEASEVTRRYVDLAPEARSALLEFLATLQVPESTQEDVIR